MRCEGVRRLDAVVEFGARRVEAGDYLSRAWFAPGDYAVMDDDGRSLTDAWLGVHVRAVEDDEQVERVRDESADVDFALDIVAARDAWVFTAFPVGDCSECPQSTAFEQEVQDSGLDAAVARVRRRLVDEAARRLVHLRRRVQSARELRMLALLEQHVDLSGETSAGFELVGFFGLEDIATAVRVAEHHGAKRRGESSPLGEITDGGTR